jgi:hypothetical protein
MIRENVLEVFEADARLAHWRAQLPEFLLYSSVAPVEGRDTIYLRQATALHFR